MGKKVARLLLEKMKLDGRIAPKSWQDWTALQVSQPGLFLALARRF
jgi:hypothetical protein